MTWGTKTAIFCVQEDALMSCRLPTTFGTHNFGVSRKIKNNKPYGMRSLGCRIILMSWQTKKQTDWKEKRWLKANKKEEHCLERYTASFIEPLCSKEIYFCTIFEATRRRKNIVLKPKPISISSFVMMDRKVIAHLIFVWQLSFAWRHYCHSWLVWLLK